MIKKSLAKNNANTSLPTTRSAQRTARPSPNCSFCLKKHILIPSGKIFLTISVISFLPFKRSANSSSLLPSKWSSNVSRPTTITSSAEYYISGLSMMGKSSLGIALVASKILAPNHDTKKTAFQTFNFILINSLLRK